MFKKGQKVFSRRGEEAEFIGEVDGTLFVYPMLFCMDPQGNDYLEPGQVAEWSEAFPNPPVKKINEEVAALEVKKLQMEEDIRGLRQQTQLAEIEAKKVVESLKKYDGLQFIEDYLEGKITHYVIKNWNGVEINAANMAKGDGRNYDSDYERNTRLFVLFGTPDKKVRWELHEYHTYHGKDQVWPFTSLKAAKEKLKEVCLEELENVKPEMPWCYEKWIQAAKKEGIEIGVEYSEAIISYNRQCALDDVSKKEKELEATIAKHAETLTPLETLEGKGV